MRSTLPRSVSSRVPPSGDVKVNAPSSSNSRSRSTTTAPRSTSIANTRRAMPGAPAVPNRRRRSIAASALRQRLERGACHLGEQPMGVRERLGGDGAVPGLHPRREEALEELVQELPALERRSAVVVLGRLFEAQHL